MPPTRTDHAPVYIVSRGRAHLQITSRELDGLGVPHYVVVEESERQAYHDARYPRATILTLEPYFQRTYDPCDDLGMAKCLGAGPARNFAWEHAKAIHSAAWYWVIDDNIRCFYRLNRNEKIRVGDGTAFQVMEDFADRYRNVALAGPNYESLCRRRAPVPPFVKNTRIYSCLLIRTSLPFRWRGRYNEDTDLSLRCLKAGWATVQFNAFLQKKLPTQTLDGGNTDAFYRREGTGPKSEMLARLHPDVAIVTHKYRRIHHEVTYRPFKHIPLIFRDDVQLKRGIYEYGMQLVSLPRAYRRLAIPGHRRRRRARA
jgi:hypothetical protein